MRRKGFTLLELLVVVGIIGLLVGLLAPQLSRVMAMTKATKCQASLNTIGKGIVQYSTFNKGNNPRLRSYPTTDAGVNEAPTTGSDVQYGDGVDVDDGSGGTTTSAEDWAVLGDQAMQNVWLMFSAGTAAEQAFECAADTEFKKRSNEYTFGYTSPFQYSYGMQWPYERAADNATPNTAPFNATLENVIVFADASPVPEGSATGLDEYTLGMHKTFGFNVLWSSGSVGSHGTNNQFDSKAGYADDDVYLGGPDGSAIAGDMPTKPAAPVDGYNPAYDTSIASSGRLGGITADP